MDGPQAEKGWIMTVFPVDELVKFPGMGTLQNDYSFVHWSDYLRNQDEYSDKIRVVLTFPTASMPELWTEELLGRMTNLRAISTLSIGVDHVNIPLLKKLGIKLGHAVGATKDTTADHAFCLMMTAARRMPELLELSRGYKEGETLSVGRSQSRPGTDIHEMALGIVGMGDIGYEVAKRAKGFRMKVFYHNRTQRSREDEEAVNATYCPTLGDLLPNVDYLVLSAPLTESTVNLMSRDQFQMMKPTAFIINVARGKLINTDDLVDALRNKVIAGAALDVTEPEPLADTHPLHQMSNVYITPHAAVLTRQGVARVCMKVAENVRAAMEGKPMPGEYKSLL